MYVTGGEGIEPHVGRRLLEAGDLSLPMSERLRLAIRRMISASAHIELRKVQKSVIENTIRYFEGLLGREEVRAPYARIVLPPRTGKTVIAASIISRSELTSVFVVPKRVIADQAAQEFRTFLPGVPVSVYSGESRDLVEHGIIVATYQKLWADLKKRAIPEVIRQAALVFADEAHRSMTKKRQELLDVGFNPHAVRIALTATPDYNEERYLAKYFPDLIHEITIQEGVNLELLSPVRAYSAEVDVDASEVRVFSSGEYEQEALGLVMSRAPMLKGVEMVRYAPEYCATPALITCATRAQAMSLFEYLAGNRPDGTPCPAPILGNTSAPMRRDFLQKFERGELDTLITVGVLVEGWNAPKCKLLIDLAPSLSWVRSAQKYARVMTPYKGRRATIFVLRPSGLPRPPILPMDVFGPSVEEALEVLRSSGGSRKKRARSSAWARMRDAGILVERIHTRVQIQEEYSIDRVDLDPKNWKQVAALVLEAMSSGPSVGMKGFSEFSHAYFQVADVTLRGKQLLRTLGCKATYAGYKSFLAKYFPDVYSGLLLKGWSHELRESSADRFLHEFYAPATRKQSKKTLDSTLAAVTGHIPDDPEKVLYRSELRSRIREFLETLSPIKQCVLLWRFGLEGEDELTLDEVGGKLGLSKERVRQVESEALRDARQSGFFELPKIDDHRGLLGWEYQRGLEKVIRAHRRRVLINGAPWVLEEDQVPAVALIYDPARLAKYGVRVCGSREAPDLKWLECRRKFTISCSPLFRRVYGAWFSDERLYVRVSNKSQYSTTGALFRTFSISLR